MSFGWVKYITLELDKLAFGPFLKNIVVDRFFAQSKITENVSSLSYEPKLTKYRDYQRYKETRPLVLNVSITLDQLETKDGCYYSMSGEVIYPWF